MLTKTKPSTASGTDAVHSGRTRQQSHHALITPLIQTATYTFRDSAELSDFMHSKAWGDGSPREEYGRYGNPTVAAVERRLAALEGADDALLYASGMAAITTTILSMLPTGSHIILTDDCYRRTRQFALTFLKRLGIESSIVPMGDYSALEAAIQDNTRLIVSESPTNPYLRVLDLPRLVEIARSYRVKTMIDATFASPANQRPIDFGVDLVVHSGTKYLGGHNDLLAGVVAGKQSVIDALRQSRGVLGAVIDPHAAWPLERGIKTLSLRVTQQNRNALELAYILSDHPKVRRVWYPGLESHPDHAIAAEQMAGFGGVVSFEIDGTFEDTARFIDALQIPLIAPSLGGVESLVEQPALMSYSELTSEERVQIGISDSLVRYAAGIEDPHDLVDDVLHALAVL